ncbi:MAG TPA: globin domain-containing protein [Gemmatimonadaceae bacterium]|jgi:hemoglobin-like flavoprotein|nr:globin domain-containing protein [Gemmatimonadaceae bacterium]
MTIMTSDSLTPRAVPVGSITPAHASELRRTWQLVAPMADEAAQLFYARLFELDPSLRSLFHTGADVRRRKLMDALTFIVTSADRPEDLLPMLAALGERHVAYGVRAEHYATAGEALLWTLDQGLGALRTPAAREAWVTTYAVIAAAMTRG